MRTWMRGVLAGFGAAMSARAAIRRLHRTDLAGKVVLITGGSRGLGLELARAFGERGAQLALCARDEGELLSAQYELRQLGYRVATFVCDVGFEEQVQRMMRQVVEEFGGIDVLVNNAGIIQVGPAKTLSLADFRDAMDANFYGMLHTTWAALPHLRAQGSGRVVNITSIGGEVSVPHLLSYSCAKFAAVGFSTGLRAELLQEGIVVTTIVPGLMRTGSVDHALFKGERGREYRLFATSGSMPGLTLNSARAARRIVSACENGESFVTLGVPAKVLRELAAVFPRVTSAAMGVVARLLPEGDSRLRGKDALPGALYRQGTPRAATYLSDRAAERNNERRPWH